MGIGGFRRARMIDSSLDRGELVRTGVFSRGYSPCLGEFHDLFSSGEEPMVNDTRCLVSSCR